MNNLFWSIYKSLEKDILSMTMYINFDDNQLNCYSTKFIDLLLRICIEIEAISKQLYLDNGGIVLEHEDEMFFDTVCLNFLEDKFKLSKKTIYIKNINVFFENQENIELQPLNKANKRGSSGSDWKKAYQAVKHNRLKNFKLGNMKNVIKALGALFILNIYYNNQTFYFENEIEANNFDTTLGSNLFIIKLNKNIEKMTEDIEKDESSIYNLKLKDEIRLEAIQSVQKINTEFIKHIIEDGRYIDFNNLANVTDINNRIQNAVNNIDEETKKYFMRISVKESGLEDVLNNRKFYAYLNKR